MLTPTLAKIKEQVSKVDDWLKKTHIRDIDAKLGVGTRWGFEEEYSTREFKACIKELAGDIHMCIKAHAQFIHLSTHSGRVKLADELTILASSLATDDYSTAFTKFELLKQMIRYFRARRTTESRSELDKQINESHRLVSLLQVDLEEVKTHVDDATGYGKNISEIAQQADASRKQLQEQQTVMQDIQGQLQDQLRNVEELAAKLQSQRETIDHFVAKIEERQQQLQEQQATTKSYEEKLEAYSEDMDQNHTKVGDLMLEAKDALQHRTAAGISAAFIARYDEYKDQRSWLWLVGAGGFLVMLVVFVFFFFWQDATQSLEPMLLIYRFAVASAIFSGAYFCAAQYKKHKNVQEDYGFKAVLAKSIIGFLEKLPEGARDEYLARVLNEIHKDPMRKIREVDDTAPEGVLRKLSEIRKRGRNIDTKSSETPTTGSE